MSKRIGQTLFIILLWIYALAYYLEVRRLEDPSEKMTIIAVFWVFSLFAALELAFVVRRLVMEIRSGAGIVPLAVRSFLGDPRLRLTAAIIIYLWAMPHLGFYTASALAFIVFSFILGTRSPVRILITGGFVLTFIYITFSYALRLTLPQGILM